MKKLTDEKGIVLAITLGFIVLMVLSVVSLSVLIQQDVNLVNKIKNKEEARLMAEAGLNHAFANLKQNGFDSKANFSGSLDTGNYSVSYTASGWRTLITSTGTVRGVTETATAEISGKSLSALNYYTGAGNDVRIFAQVGDASISGDLHGNNNVYLNSGFNAAWLDISGDVSATGIVLEGKKHNDGAGDKWDDNVSINGQTDDAAPVYEGMPRIVFPTFDYNAYKDAAVASGDYYSGNTNFNGASLAPSNGVVYVDGQAHFAGNNTISGGLVADDIVVAGTLSQYKSGNKNVVIAKDGDIHVAGKLYTQEAIVYASEDLVSNQTHSELEINGIILALRDIDISNMHTNISYTYVYTFPENMTDEAGNPPFRIESWNK